MAPVAYRKIPSLRTTSDFKEYVNQLGIFLPFDDIIRTGPDAPLNQPIQLDDKIIGNRFCALPMEGWDCLEDGRPSELTARRWRRFAISGAKLIWGAEACAVCREGKGSQRQLMINEHTLADIAGMRQSLIQTHRKHFGKSSDLIIGLQLTHSGRFAYPKPKIVYNHPVLDSEMGLEKDYPLITDEEVKQIIHQFIDAAILAEKAGFDFVDIKHCHGYLGHEFLSARTRSGPFGGSFQNRTRFLTEIISGVRANTKDLKIGVRLSIFDFLPFRKNQNKTGEPHHISGDYPFAFGADYTGLRIDLAETIKLLDVLADMGVKLICATAGSSYYNPHITRPAMSPSCDGYLPPEDPLVGVARLINATAELKKKRPDMLFIGSAYTYLQQWLPNVAQAVITSQMADSIGLGRMMLAYPDIVADILTAKPLDKKRICLTNSDCTTAPRSGLVSGCFSRDPFYRARPEFKKLNRIKKAIRNM
jgi:2,4-dienoyl-CoA reductase-like NADH-dependent reductase (Old Yellow Enzyme family)